jgi:hypothetical protein
MIQRLIEHPTPPASEHPSRPTEPGASEPPLNTVLLEGRLNPADSEAVTEFLTQARNALTAQGEHTISLALVRRENVK